MEYVITFFCRAVLNIFLKLSIITKNKKKHCSICCRSHQDDCRINIILCIYININDSQSDKYSIDHFVTSFITHLTCIVVDVTYILIYLIYLIYTVVYKRCKYRNSPMQYTHKMSEWPSTARHRNIKQAC